MTARDLVNAMDADDRAEVEEERAERGPKSPDPSRSRPRSTADVFVVVGPSTFVLLRAGDRIPADLIGKETRPAVRDKSGGLTPGRKAPARREPASRGSRKPSSSSKAGKK